MSDEYFNIFFLICATWAIGYWLFFSWTLIYYKNPKKMKKDIEELTANNSPLFSTNQGGKIDVINFTILALKTEIYDDCIILKPSLIPNVILRKSEIMYFKVLDENYSKYTEIVHRSEYIKSPLIIYDEIPLDLQEKLKSGD